MAEFPDDASKAIKEHPLCNDLRDLRESLRGLQQVYVSTSQSDSSSIDISLSPLEELLIRLARHPVAYVLEVKNDYISVKLGQVAKHIRDHEKGSFDYQRYRALLSLVIEEESSDSAIWRSVIVLIQRPSTAPASRSTTISSLEQTPYAYSSGGLESTSEYRENLNPVLQQELRPSLRIDVPDFVKDVFRQVSPLEKLAVNAFEHCQRMKEPAYKAGKGWTEWPQIPAQKEVRKFLEKIVACLISFAEKENGHVTHVRRRINTQPDEILAGSSTSRKMDTDVVIDNGQCTNNPPHLKNILVVKELKSNPDKNNHEDTFIDLAQYAREVFRAQDRRFVLGFTLCGSMIRL